MKPNTLYYLPAYLQFSVIFFIKAPRLSKKNMELRLINFHNKLVALRLFFWLKDFKALLQNFLRVCLV